MRTEPVTRDEMNALADDIEEAGKDYMVVIEKCDDPELLRQAAMELLVRAMGRTAADGFLALVRDEIIQREMYRVQDRERRKKHAG